MKKNLLSLLLIAAPVWTGHVVAQEEKRDAPREERKEGKRMDGEVGERMQAEQRNFREKMEKQMKAAMQEAAELDAAGRKDEAEARRTQAKVRLEAAVKEHQTMMQRKNQAAMRERADGDRRPDSPPPAELEEKLKHLEQAVAHLREAGMPDVAENVARMAEPLRQKMRGEGGPRPENDRRPEEVRRPDARLEGQLDGLRREIQELREAVRRLSAEKDD